MMIATFNSVSSSSAEAVGRDITARHNAYLEAARQWRRVDHVLAGVDAVKDNAADYIPRTQDHRAHPESFDEMVRRSSFVNWTGRTLDGLEGLIFRKEMEVTVPDQYKVRLANLNNAGDGVDTLAKKIVRGILSHGRLGILVDCMPKHEQRSTDAVSLLPFLTVYGAWNITNWRPRTINGKRLLDQIILSEYYEEPLKFGSVTRIRYRELALDKDGRYFVRLYEANAAGEYREVMTDYPRFGSNNGLTYLNEIPFVFINPIDLSADVHRSPILDIVDTNLHHFILNAYHGNALFLTSEPTPVITGWPEGVPGDFKLGGGRVLILPEGANAEMLEFHGDGLGPLERAMQADKEHIQELGASLLQPTANAPETASAVRIRQHGQTSVISSIARTVSDGIKEALEHACRWARIEGKIEVELNQDYIDASLDPRMLAELRTTCDMGYMPKLDYAYNLRKGELTRPGQTDEEFVEALDTEKPVLIGRPNRFQFAQQVTQQPANEPMGQVVNRSNGGAEVKVKPKAPR